MTARRVLVLDGDDRRLADACAGLAHLGEVEEVSDPRAAAAYLDRGAPDLVVVAVEAVPVGADALEALGSRCGSAALVLVGDPARRREVATALGDGHAVYVDASPSAAALGQAGAQALELTALRCDNARLRTTVETLEACGRLTRCLDPGTAFAEALDLLLDTTGRERGLAHFRRPAIPGAEGLIFRGFTRSEARRLRATLGTTEPLGHGAGDRPTIVAEGPLHELLTEIGVADPGAALLVPLAAEEREAGVIYLFNDGVGFTEYEIERANIVARQAQAALENAERYQGAKRRALLDDVTGLHNAAYFVDAADHEIERAARYGLELSVLFLDIDRFKRVNDAHGHLIGSATLRHVGQCLQNCVRQIDTLVRYGGDEFTMLMTDTPPAAALKAADRIRDIVAQSRFEDDGGHAVSVTVSIGVACYPHDSTRRDELVDLADKAMYRAKSIGRNQVVEARALSE